MVSSEYTVRLDAFEGPLDLLLFLIRRAEVEITDIPVAQITDQYLKHIEHLMGPDDARAGSLDIERAGEFLVMAATLMEVKSRMLVPVQVHAQDTSGDGSSPASPGKPVIDPRAELVQQLLEYKRFRDASDMLDRAKREYEDMFPARRVLAGQAEVAQRLEQIDQDGPVDLADLGLIDLVEAFAKIVDTVDFNRVGEHRIVMDDTPVEIHAEDIVDQLRKRALAAAIEGGPSVADLPFASVFEGRNRAEMIGLFLAVLELVKQQRILVRQESEDRLGRRIVLCLAAESADVPSPAAQP